MPDCINIDLIDKQKFDKDENQILSVLGAFLDNPNRINLLPLEIKQQRLEDVLDLSFKITAGVIGIVFFIFFANMVFNMFVNNHKLKNSKAYLESIKEIKILNDDISPVKNLIFKIQKGKAPETGVLKLVSAVIPKDVILDGLEFSQESHSLILKGTLKGSSSKITEFIKGLEAVSFIKSAKMVSSNFIDNTMSFEIDCVII